MKRTLRERFRDPEYREAYWDEFSENRLAGQLALTRQLRKMTQKQVADAAGMHQSQISGLEDEPGASELATLRRVAAALDVALSVRLISWEQAVREIESQGRVSMEIPDAMSLSEPSKPSEAPGAWRVYFQTKGSSVCRNELTHARRQRIIAEWVNLVHLTVPRSQGTNALQVIDDLAEPLAKPQADPMSTYEQLGESSHAAA